VDKYPLAVLFTDLHKRTKATDFTTSSAFLRRSFYAVRTPLLIVSAAYPVRVETRPCRGMKS
jgi:hypothetical protein